MSYFDTKTQPPLIAEVKLWEENLVNEALFYANITEQIKRTIKHAKEMKIHGGFYRQLFSVAVLVGSDLIPVRRKCRYRCVTFNKRTVEKPTYRQMMLTRRVRYGVCQCLMKQNPLNAPFTIKLHAILSYYPIMYSYFTPSFSPPMRCFSLKS